ncbi:ubiquinol-cytochrome c reductase iron-sulfur subunit [Polyangium aurulentum]|uniref:QcrA and Rieske domain-containing protein n=1 Tax=Polyangium aurulentum TaxID=2567896 RepID=UPI001F2551FA|nr:Rieske 2Fe-2S domain-containing protein [Polyangium aurulentum]
MQNPGGDEAPRPEPTIEPSRSNPDRRTALRALVTLGGCAYAGVIAVPGAQFLAPSAEDGQGKARWIRVGRLEDLPQGEPRRLAVVGDERDAFNVTKDQQLGAIWVVREGEKVRAMSAVCPHLGCSIDIGADKKSFSCPCHTSRFSLAGAAESGPSPRAMDPLDVRVTEGFVEVDFKRFRLGIAERMEVG